MKKPVPTRVMREHPDLDHRPPDDPWWGEKLDESVGRGNRDTIRMLLERCDVRRCASTIMHRMAGRPG